MTLKINKEEAVLVVIDFQERLMPAMEKPDELKDNVVKLILGCDIMDVPMLVTQQYTRGLGPTITDIHDALGEYKPIEKTAFSAMGEPEFVERLKATGRKTVILIGIETHVCVQQTAIDLIESAYTVFIVDDCISSRKSIDRDSGLARMLASGAIKTTAESVLFELVKDAKNQYFKAISSLVK